MSSLKEKTLSGVGWSGVSNAARQLLQVITIVVMARLMSPDDFGLFAILMVFIGFMQIFGSMGTAQVIVHLDFPSQRLLSSLFYFNIAIGLLLQAILFFLAQPISNFFEETSLEPLLKISSVTFLISALTLVQKALLEKEMHFKRIAMLEVISLTIGSVVGIISAFNGLGVYALVIMSIGQAAMLSLLLWLNSHWRPNFIFNFNDIKVVWKFTINLTGFYVVNYFSRNSDTFLVGKFLGAPALGIYNIAYKIMLYPLENIARVIVRVIFPAFSRLKGDNLRFRNAYLQAIAFIGLVTFPLMSGLCAVSESLVYVLFGSKWEGLAPLLVILAPIGMMQSIVTTVGSIYTSKGTTSLMLRIGTVNSLVTVLSFLIGLPFGVKGVAFCYFIANLVMLYPNLKYAWKQIDLSLKDGLNCLAPFWFSSIAMALTVYFMGTILKSYGMEVYILLLTQVFLGAVLYFGVLYILCRERVIFMFRAVIRKKHDANS